MSFLLLLSVFGCDNEKVVQVRNSAPSIQIASHLDGDEVFVGQALQFSATAADSNHDFAELQVQWSVGERVVCSYLAPDAEGLSTCTAAFQDGDSRITAQVRDPSGATGLHAVELTTIESEAPVVTIVSPLDNAVLYADEPIAFIGQAVDVEDTELDIYWESSIDGRLSLELETEADGTVSAFGSLSAGTHGLSLVAVDSSGKVGNASISVQVQESNTTPFCEITSPATGSAGAVGSLVLFEGQVSDPDIAASQLLVTWQSDKDGEIGTSTAASDGSVTFPYADLSADSHVISLTAVDDQGGECVHNILYTVDSPPTIQIVEPLANDRFGLGQAMMLQAEVNDQETAAELLGVQWSSSVDGYMKDVVPDASGQAYGSFADLSPGEHILTATVTDEVGLSASASVAVTIDNCSDLWFADTDGDGYGGSVFEIGCTPSSGYVADNSDCDDGNAAIFPGADEYCDGIDNDCDWSIDENHAVDALTWYHDNDGDGYGELSQTVLACDQPTGYVANSSDCDDATATTYPGADEYCDLIDNNCDGATDEATAVDASVWYIDMDSDGYGGQANTIIQCYQPGGYVADGNDCDDGNAAIHPWATEYCNSIDDDCDNIIDESGAADADLWYADNDNDGYGDAGQVMSACDQPAGYVANYNDCNDADVMTYPGADEYCDSLDNDCDGTIDEDPVDGTAYYQDADLDGYGDENSVIMSCNLISGLTTTGGDCDDTDPDIHPAAIEYCDGVDNDCDGSVDADDPDTTAVPAGIIAASETWTEADSPYCFTGNVQLAAAATLTMEPGTIVGGVGHNLDLFGRLDVNGTDSQRVEISDLQIRGGLNSSQFVIDISYAHIQGGSLFTGTPAYTGVIYLTDSVLENLSSYMYLWYPNGDCYFERNIFINSPGISAGTSGWNVYVTNNVFYNQQGSYAIKDWASYGGGDTIVQYNSFVDTDRVAVMLPAGYSSSAILATNNYWSTTDVATIESMIYDQNDDLSCAGTIDYSGYLSAPHADTPDHIPWVQ